MKKLIAMLFAFVCIANLSAFAVQTKQKHEVLIKFEDAEYAEWKTIMLHKHISEIGFKILNANGLENRVTFYYDLDRNTPNAYSRFDNRGVVVKRGIIYYLDSDDEIAAILSHEIAHSQESYKGSFRGYFSDLAYIFHVKKHEINADKKGVDYMVKAGYNPIALIIALNKISGEARYEWFFTSYPLTHKRLMYIYEYIYRKYPQYLAKNVYKDNVYYQNFLLVSAKNRAKLQEALKNPEMKNKKIKYK